MDSETEESRPHSYLYVISEAGQKAKKTTFCSVPRGADRTTRGEETERKTKTRNQLRHGRVCGKRNGDALASNRESVIPFSCAVSSCLCVFFLFRALGFVSFLMFIAFFCVCVCVSIRVEQKFATAGREGKKRTKTNQNRQQMAMR